MSGAAPRTVLIVLALLVGACGDDAPRISGSSAEDKAMAERIDRYFERNGKTAAWYDKLDAIRVKGGVITIETHLDLEGAERPAARQICGLIQGSDEADFTSGHTVTGSGGAAVECPARRRG